MDFKTWNRNFKPGDWNNYRGANGSAQALNPNAGVDDLTNMGAKDVAKQTYRTAVNANKTLPAGSWMAKEVPGAAGRGLDRAAAKVGLMAPEIGSAGEAAAKAGFGARAAGAAGALLNPINPLHATTSVLAAGAQGLNTSTDEYRQRMGLDSQDQADSVVGDTLVRGLGLLQDVGNKVTYGLAGELGTGIANLWQDNPADTPLLLDPATAAKGKAIAARPAPVAQPIDKAQQQADALAYGVAADPDGSYAKAEAARFSNQPAPPPNHKQLEKQAMDPNATEADRIKAVGQQYGVDPKNITFRQMGPDSVFKVGKNIFTDGSDPTNRVSNMNEPWTPAKAASLENAGRIERYNNYLRAGYDPATAEKLLNGGRIQDDESSFRSMAKALMDKASGMKYGGTLRDDAIALLGLAQKQDAEEAAAKAAQKGSFRDMLAVQQFGLDKQKFAYQQNKDEAEFNRGVTKDKAALLAEQKAAAAKSHEERMKALFTDPKSGQIDQAAAADFNRRAAGFAADLGKNIDQLTSEEFGRLQSLKAMHDLAKDRAGLLFHKGSYKDNADYRAYEPIMKNGKVEVEQGIGGTFIKLRNGSLVNLEDLKKKGGLPILRWFGQSTSPSNYGVDPTTLPQ